MCKNCDNTVEGFMRLFGGLGGPVEKMAGVNGSAKQARETPKRIEAKAGQFDALVAGLTSIGRKPCCETHAVEILLSDLAGLAQAHEERDTARAQRDMAEALRKAEVGRHHTVAAELAALREEYQKTCELVAQMHAAATGRSGEAPTVGVVEDVAAVAADRDRLAEANATAQRDREAMGRRLAERGDEVGQLTEQLRQAKAGNIDGGLRGGILRGGQW